jgi:hypothetical protein
METTFGVSSRTWQRVTPRAEASARAASSKSSGFWPGISRSRTSSHDAPERTPSTWGSCAGTWLRLRRMLRPSGVMITTAGAASALMLRPQACSQAGSFGA